MIQRKVLVVRLSSLGDVVLTAPVFRNLKAAWPEAKVVALVKEKYAAVLEGQPGVDEILPFKGLLPALRAIRAGGFTHLLDLHANLRSLLIRRLSGIPNVACYRKDALARRLFVWTKRRSPTLERHTLDRYLESLSAWGIPPLYRNLELPRAGPAVTEAAPALEAACPPTGQAASPKPSNIVVLQTAFLGDAALTAPLLQGLRKRFPSARLTVVSRPGTAELFGGLADEVLPDDKRGSGRGPTGFLRLLRGIRERRFDLALLPHRSLRSALLAFLARIPERVGFDSSAGSFLLTRKVPFTWLRHDLERNLSLLGPLGSPPLEPQEGATAGLDRKSTGRVIARLAASGRDPARPLVGVHPGSVWPTKRWLPGRFAALIRRLCLESRAQVILVGGEADRLLAASIREDSGAGPDCLDWTGQTTLSELMDLMQGLSLFITNDSGPMHVATASGVPTLALFGPTTRELGFFPYGPGHRVLEKELPCRPCGLHGARECPEGHFLCMRLITVEEVADAAREMLASREASRPL